LPSLLSVSSHIVAGRVGQSASSFAFQRLGCDVWALPSVLYPVTPAPGAARGASVPQDLFELLIAGLSAEQLGRLAALHVGYLRDSAQVRAVARLIARVRAAAPHALIFLDPILGDEPGGLYVPADTAAAIKAELVGAADLMTPNLFELGFLTGHAVGTEREAIEAARGLKAKAVVVTSAPGAGAGEASTLLVEPGRAWRMRTARFASAPHGTGDLLAALFLARLVLGEAASSALAEAVASVHDLILAAKAGGLDYLPIIERQELLIAPATRLVAEAIAAP